MSNSKRMYVSKDNIYTLLSVTLNRCYSPNGIQAMVSVCVEGEKEVSTIADMGINDKRI
jgi:hypothetical protein